MKTFLVLLGLGIFSAGVAALSFAGKKPDAPGTAAEALKPRTGNVQVATFAGGCFWCVEADFEKLNGVAEAISGYTGGQGEHPTYDDYAQKGHVEAVQVFYDPDKVSYRELLDFFWRHVDPTDPGGQFVDRGKQYRSAIFYHNDEQHRLAEASKRDLEKSGRFAEPIVTEIVPFTTFYRAEDYHQDYYRNHSWRYKYYRRNSGRDQFLQRVWGK